MHLKKISNPDIGEYLRLVDLAHTKYDEYQESMTKENSDAFLAASKIAHDEWVRITGGA